LGGRMRPERRPVRTEAAIGEPEQHLMGALVLGIELGDGYRPACALVDAGHAALLAPANLILEERDERRRAAADRNHALGAALSRFSTAASSLSIRAFGGSAHSGSGIRSIFRRFSRWETISARRPFSAKRATSSAAAASRALSSEGVAWRRSTSCGPSASTRKTSEPRFRHRKSRPGPAGRTPSCGSTLPI